MTREDDRPWKAEDLLRSVIGAEREGTASVRERIERYFDKANAPVGELPTVSIVPKADAAAPGDVVGTDEAPVRRRLPTKPPVAVPNHDLIRCLGAGGFGQVWLARHTLTEHYRACKLIPADKSLELDGLRRLKKKVPTHPNLYPIEEVGVARDWLYVLMPLADPASTDQVVLDDSGYEPLTLGVYIQRHGRRPAAEAAAIGLDITSGLRHLHAHGVTHGDIKPGNILRHGGHWTLADYGLASDLSSPSGQGYTPDYTPPEGPGTAGADQYALGIVLMELLTNWPARMHKNFRETPVEHFRLDGTGPALAGVIARATADAPRERFGSLDELADCLASLAGLSPPASRRRSKRRLVAIAASLTLVVGGAIVAVVLSQAARAPETSGAVNAAAPALAVESFEIRRWRDGQELQSLGTIDAENPGVREHEHQVTVHARFNRPASVYLVSLDADGEVRLRWPASEDLTPSLTDHIDYPCRPGTSEDEKLFGFVRGPGTQGFLLLGSADPLPPWRDWVARRGRPTWTRESLPPGTAVSFDGREVHLLSSTRDPVLRRGRVTVGPIDWAKAQENLAVRFMAFTVLPKEE